MIIRDNNFQKIDSYNKKVLRKNIYSNKNISDYLCCPQCGSNDYIKFGKYEGIQRYKCKSCSKTFSNSTNSLWKYLKHSPEKWIKFLELLIEEKTLKECSKILNISVVTAFNWRHKILHRIENLYTPKEFKNLIFMEINYRKISYKGSKNKHFEYESKFNKRYNIAPQDVYTLISYDINDEMLIKNLGVYKKYNIESNKEVLKKFEDIIYNYCDSKSYIHINPLFTRFIYSHVIKHNKRIPLKNRKLYEFTPDNIYKMDNIEWNSNVSIKFNDWLKKFRGVATKYLNHYGNLFSLSIVGKEFDSMKIFRNLLSPSCKYVSVKLMDLTHVDNY